MANTKTENLYDVLKVSSNASITEIVNAYHIAKGAFSKDSVATYSLFSPEETKEVMARLEQAYHQLSSLEKRREYDQYLAEVESGKTDADFVPTPLPSSGPALRLVTTENGDANAPLVFSENTAFTGQLLHDIRDRKALSIDDVSRITKIPSKFIRAIESQDPKHLPARVYLQGFVKNLAALYKLDPASVTKSYLECVDQNKNSEAK